MGVYSPTVKVRVRSLFLLKTSITAVRKFLIAPINIAEFWDFLSEISKSMFKISVCKLFVK